MTGPCKKIFISHASKDEHIAKALRDLFIPIMGRENIFSSTDIDPMMSIEAGENWKQCVINKILSCHIMVSVVTLQSRLNPWLNFESGIAIGLNIRRDDLGEKNSIRKTTETKVDLIKVIPISCGISDDEMPGPLSDIQATKTTIHDLKKLINTLIFKFGGNAIDKEEIEILVEDCQITIENILDAEYDKVDKDNKTKAIVVYPDEANEFWEAFRHAQEVYAYNPPLNLLVKSSYHRTIVLNRLRRPGFKYHMIVGPKSQERLEELIKEIIGNHGSKVFTDDKSDNLDNLKIKLYKKPNIFEKYVKEAFSRVDLNNIEDDSTRSELYNLKKTMCEYLDGCDDLNDMTDLHTEMNGAHYIKNIRDIRGMSYFIMKSRVGREISYNILLYPFGEPFASDFIVPNKAIMLIEKKTNSSEYQSFKTVFKNRWNRLDGGVGFKTYYETVLERESTK